MDMKTIARIHSDFPTKFGIPRQSGFVEDLHALIVFEPEYRNPDAVRGIEEFSYLWLIWVFSEAIRDTWSPTVRPPRLGGNLRKGVFATRSPFRPNSLGLSCVKLQKVETDPSLGPVLHVNGADLMDGTPILDIKPYLPFSESHPDAACGLYQETLQHRLTVDFSPEWLNQIPIEKQNALIGVLANDPRPAYHQDPERVYGFGFAGMEIRFQVKDNILTVCDVERLEGIDDER